MIPFSLPAWIPFYQAQTLPFCISMALWQPLAVFDIKDPRHHGTCVGTTKKGKPCHSRISRETRQNARYRLETLSFFPVNLDYMKTVMESIAGMLLCK